MKHNEIIGKKYGMLTVISDSGKRAGNGDIVFDCLCDCGNHKLVSRSNLVTKSKYKTISCGCYVKNGKHVWNKDDDRKVHIQKSLYDKLKRRQKKLGFSLNNLISFDEFVDILGKECHYCGIKNSDLTRDTYVKRSSNGIKAKGTPVTTFEYAHNGIDRIDSNKGYEINNVVPSCKYCNFAKSNRTQSEFLSWSKNVYEYFVLNKRSNNG